MFNARRVHVILNDLLDTQVRVAEQDDTKTDVKMPFSGNASHARVPAYPAPASDVIE